VTEEARLVTGVTPRSFCCAKPCLPNYYLITIPLGHCFCLRYPQRWPTRGRKVRICRINRSFANIQPAFRSLIETITKDDPQTKLSPEAITRLTEKLGEIVGYDAGKDFAPVRNERGEVCSSPRPERILIRNSGLFTAT
jgi:hypothetical protein